MTEHDAHVLVVEDESQMQTFVETLLTSHDYQTTIADTGEEALRLAAQHNPDVVLLDLGLPEIDGIEVIRRLREWTQTPIIVLSVRDKENDKVEALDEGADDYLTKPFGSKELLARLRVTLRHLAQRDVGDDESMIFETGALRVDFGSRRVEVEGEPVSLTPTEYQLLSTLVRHAGKVLTHRFLLEEVWGPPYTGRNHYVRVYIARLRDKLEDDPANPSYIVTETGVGYRLEHD
jgi:two-component system KDP operon response regulator KdpE